MAKSGFGGTEYLLPALVSEGTQARHGATTTWRASPAGPGAALRPATARATSPKASTPTSRSSTRAKTWTIRASESPSTQGYTPFEGLELSARVDATFLRGMTVYEDGQIVGKPRGQYLHRPTA